MMSRSRTARSIFSPRILLLGLALLALQGCGMIYRTTGDVLIMFGRSEMLPYMMAMDDTQMGCAAGEALTPLLLAFERVGSDPDSLAVLVYVTAGTCADSMALEEELRYLRAVRAGSVSEAQDARIAQKRYAALASRRQYEAYRRLVTRYGEMTDNECPKLKSDFDELVWMVGLISGVQALLNDGVADASVGVPRDLAAKVERGAACLDNEKWWGVPRGVRASLWGILPMLAPPNVEPWKELETASQTGFEQGVRLGSAMYAISAYSQGDDRRLRKAIRDFAANDENINLEYRMLDAMAGTMIESVSDRLWTEATGKRTPLGGLGTFWDDAPSRQPSFNIDDLL